MESGNSLDTLYSTRTGLKVGCGVWGGGHKATCLELGEFFKKWNQMIYFAILGCTEAYHYHLRLNVIQ